MPTGEFVLVSVLGVVLTACAFREACYFLNWRRNIVQSTRDEWYRTFRMLRPR